MDVEDLLASRLAVSEEEVDALAIERRAPQCGRCELTDAEELGTVFGIEIGEVRRVRPWHDEEVSAYDRLDVHEDDRPLVLEDDAGLDLAGDEPAEQALRVEHVHGSWLDPYQASSSSRSSIVNTRSGARTSSATGTP